MAGERLPARFLLRSKLRFRWTGKCFETATSHMQTVTKHITRTVLTADNISLLESYFTVAGSRNYLLIKNSKNLIEPSLLSVTLLLMFILCW